MKYKILITGLNKISYTNDKIFADFMNKNLTFWQRIKLFFMR